jgi:hypothetical protein
MNPTDLDYWLGRLACLFGWHHWYQSVAFPREKTCLKCGKKVRKKQQR